MCRLFRLVLPWAASAFVSVNVEYARRGALLARKKAKVPNVNPDGTFPAEGERRKQLASLLTKLQSASSVAAIDQAIQACVDFGVDTTNPAIQAAAQKRQAFVEANGSVDDAREAAASVRAAVPDDDSTAAAVELTRLEAVDHAAIESKNDASGAPGVSRPAESTAGSEPETRQDDETKETAEDDGTVAVEDDRLAAARATVRAAINMAAIQAEIDSAKLSRTPEDRSAGGKAVEATSSAPLEEARDVAGIETAVVASTDTGVASDDQAAVEATAELEARLDGAYAALCEASDVSAIDAALAAAMEAGIDASQDQAVAAAVAKRSKLEAMASADSLADFDAAADGDQQLQAAMSERRTWLAAMDSALLDDLEALEDLTPYYASKLEAWRLLEDAEIDRDVALLRQRAEEAAAFGIESDALERRYEAVEMATAGSSIAAIDDAVRGFPDDEVRPALAKRRVLAAAETFPPDPDALREAIQTAASLGVADQDAAYTALARAERIAALMRQGARTVADRRRRALDFEAVRQQQLGGPGQEVVYRRRASQSQVDDYLALQRTLAVESAWALDDGQTYFILQPDGIALVPPSVGESGRWERLDDVSPLTAAVRITIGLGSPARLATLVGVVSGDVLDIHESTTPFLGVQFTDDTRISLTRVLSA